MNKNAERK